MTSGRLVVKKGFTVHRFIVVRNGTQIYSNIKQMFYDTQIYSFTVRRFIPTLSKGFCGTQIYNFTVRRFIPII